jgi:hypothetical protein
MFYIISYCNFLNSVRFVVICSCILNVGVLAVQTQIGLSLIGL